MNETAKLYNVSQRSIWLEIYDDPFNKRMRIDDYFGDVIRIIKFAEKLMKEKQREKLIFKVRKEHFTIFYEHGFMCEAMIDGYFLGSDAYFFTKYYFANRLENDHWITEDQMINSINELVISKDTIEPPNQYELRKINESDCEKLALLYQEVFEIYPTPLHDPEYIKKTIIEGTIYFAFYYNGNIVSAASAEVNRSYRNAELTDCATLPQHRKYGLMKIILKKLEEELMNEGIFTAYSIARSLSFGMNAVLHQMEYKYRGRLKNNCFIYDKLENMNVWVKNLASTPDIQH